MPGPRPARAAAPDLPTEGRMAIEAHKLPMNSPADVSALAALIESGEVDPGRIVALIGKTEGNGGANDFTRGFATLSYSLLLARHLRATPDEVARRVAFVWSGGTEGVLSPHATVFVRLADAASAEEPRLALGIALTRAFLPEEVGTMVQVREVAAAVRQAREEAGVTSAADVHYVQVKGPLLTPAMVADATRRGARLVTQDPNGSKVYARGATGLGVALGLGELAESAVEDAAIGRKLELYSSVAHTSAGGELQHCEILLFGNAPEAGGTLRIGHGVLRDVIDAEGVRAALRAAGLAEPDPTRIVALFAKAEAPPGGMLRGRRTTMLSDADINYERHARAALGAVIASVTGDAAIFVSGGTEHQCAPGEAPIAAIVRA